MPSSFKNTSPPPASNVISCTASNSIPPVPSMCAITGSVSCLLVKVSLPVNETKLSPCKPALNSESVPVNVPKSSKSICKVFALLLIVLFVSVCVDAKPTKVSEALDGKVNVMSELGLPGVTVVSKLSSVEPSKVKLPVIVPPNETVSVAASPK